MSAPRVASERDFPYGWAGFVCYFTVSDGVPQQIRTRDDMRGALARDEAIFAVWPGEYRADLFLIDRPELLAEAVGVAGGAR